MKFTLNEHHRNVSDEELLNDIIRVANELGKQTLTMDEYKNNGAKYHSSTISRRFGGWVNAIERLNLSPTTRQRTVCTADLINDLRRIAKDLGKNTFTTGEYSVFGKYSRDTYTKRFGSWNAALTSAGLIPFDHPLGGGSKNKVSEFECLEEIERLWIELGRQPTTTDIKNGLSKYSLHTYERRFGSWRKALEFFVAYMNGDCDLEKPNELPEVSLQPIADTQADDVKFTHKTSRDIGLRMRFLVMKRDDFKCCMCGRSPATTHGLELHIDHIIPWSKGGETTIDNLQTLCSDCNLGKSNLNEKD